MIRKIFLLSLGMAFVSLPVTARSADRDLYLQADVPTRVIFMDRQHFLRIASHYGLTIRRLKVSADVKAKLAKLVPKGCGCDGAEDDSDFGSCFSNCLSTWHVNQTTVLACGVTCTAAGSGNPVGIALCAGCLGVGEWVVAGCALNCVYRGSGGGGGVGELLGKNLNHRPLKRSRSQEPNLKAKAAGFRS